MAMTEDRTYRQVAAVVLCALIAGVAIFGSWLPMRKGEIFISTLKDLQANPATSLQNLEDRAAVPLDYYAPTGQEELVRNVASSVLSFIQQGGDATSTAQLISFLNNYFDPILARKKGMSFGQDLYLEGVINELAFASTGNPQYADAAKQYFQESFDLGPNRPQTLYGLFDVYHATNDMTDTIMIGQKILSNWPSDTRIAQVLAELQAAAPKKGK